MSSFAWVVGKVVGGPNEDAATALVSASNSSAGRFVARSLACAPVVLIYCTALHFISITSLPHFARHPWLLTTSFNPLSSTFKTSIRNRNWNGSTVHLKPQSQWSAYLA